MPKVNGKKYPYTKKGKAAAKKAKKKLTSSKAKKILRDGMVRGHKLTARQKRFMGAMAGGQKPRV